MNIKISPELEWVEPYLKRASKIVPVEQLEKIIAVKPRLDQIQHCHAQLVTETDTNTNAVKRRYISMNLYYVKSHKLEPLQRKKVPFSKIDLLETLSHELAHLVEIKHTPEHKKLESKICTIFMTMLKRTGYVSEEHEMKHSRPRF